MTPELQREWPESKRRLYKPEMVGGCRKSILDPWDPRPDPQHNFVCVMPRDDIYKKVVVTVIDWGRFGVKGDLQVEVGANMHKDTGGVLEITGIGPGRVQNGIQCKPLCQVGDIVYINLFFVGHRHMVGRKIHYMFDMDNILAKLDVENRVATPVGAAIITKANDERMERAMLGGLVGTHGKQIVLHGSTKETGMNAENGRDPQKITYEEVVAVGPGKMDGDILVKPTCKVGDLVSFSKDSMATTMTLKGQKYTLVPWSHVEAIIPD